MKKIILALVILLCISCGPKMFQAKWASEIAPETFVARFETSKGNFDIEVQRIWSPKAADRFYQLVKYEYFNRGIFYRVIPDFVAQFGSSDTISKNRWNSIKLPDEKVVLGNTKGTLSFARSGKETRATDLYINLKDNSRLDTINYNDVVGFPAFGRIIKGMEVVNDIYSGYEGESASKLELLYSERRKYFEEFPKLDTIQKVYFTNE